MAHSGLGESQPALPPNDASEFLNEVLFRWALRVMLGRERRNDSGVFGPILPWQDGVAREDPVPKRIEARGLCSQVPGGGSQTFPSLLFSQTAASYVRAIPPFKSWTTTSSDAAVAASSAAQPVAVVVAAAVAERSRIGDT